MKYTITVAVTVAVNADATRKHVVLETHELTGFGGSNGRADAEASVRRALSLRGQVEIRNVREDQD
jgi:hypothetical protein